MATKNNFRRLKEEADIGMVLAFLNIPVQRKGANIFLQCPNPNHSDEHFTNCYYKDGWNNVYCYACGKSMNAIDIIMWSMGCTYGEAADVLWEIEGKPDWYYFREKSKKKKDTFSVSREELEVIGFHFPGRILMPKQIISEKRPLEKRTQYDSRYTEGYLLCDVQMCTYRDFLSEKQYAWMVKKKAQESLEKTKKSAAFLEKLLAIEKSEGVSDKDSEYLYQACLVKMEICRDIMKRAKKAAA